MLDDTDEARFDRLATAAESDPESLGWIDVVNPETDLEDVGIGALVSLECEVSIPTASQLFSKSGEAAEALDMIRRFSGPARALGLDMTGIPGDGELESVQQLMRASDAKVVLLGERDDSEWKVMATLTPECRDGEMEGFARVVGKATKVIAQNR